MVLLHSQSRSGTAHAAPRFPPCCTCVCLQGAPRVQQQVAAQAQAQQQTNINYTESLELIRCLLRVVSPLLHVSCAAQSLSAVGRLTPMARELVRMARMDPAPWQLSAAHLTQAKSQKLDGFA